MSRTTSRRLAAAAGVAVATAAAGAVLAAPASAAELRSPTVSYPATVAPGQAFTISGTGCFASPHGLPPAIILDSLDVENGTGDNVDPDGTWALPFSEGLTDLGTYHWSLTCDDYSGEASYANVVITVTPDGKPLATPAAPTATAATPPKPTAAPGCAICKALDEGKAVTPGQAMTLKWIVAPFQKVTLVLHSTPRVLGTFTADANGVLTLPVTIPADVLGSHSLNLVDEHGTTIAALPLTVAKKSSGAQLAYTGADIALPLTLGGVLVVGGAGAVMVGRRRAAHAQQARQA
jgi:hypothetical protein